MREAAQAISAGPRYYPGRVADGVDRELIKRILPVVHEFTPRRIEIPTQSQIESQLRSDLPIILNKRAKRIRPASDEKRFCTRTTECPAREQRCERISGRGLVEAEDASTGT